MTSHWITALAPDKPWDVAYAYVTEYVRTFLCGYAGPDMTTSELVALIWPKTNRDPAYQRQRLFKALSRLAFNSLADCCHRGNPRPRGHDGGKPGRERPMITPWLWHAPGEKHWEAKDAARCPHCGELL